jgi:capsular polysaccharide biosynthesis protein
LSLYDYGRILLRRGWIVLLTAALCAAAAFILSRQITPTYRASQVILIQPARNDLGLTEATTRLMNSYQVYLNSTRIAESVINTLQLDMLPGDLLSDVTIQSNRDNLTVQIDVDGQNCALVSNIAREWGNELVYYRNTQNQTVRIEDRIDAIPADNPKCPTSTTPNITINTIVGGLLGALTGIVIVFLLEYLESSTVRRRDDIERGLSLPVLATIPSTAKDAE